MLLALQFHNRVSIIVTIVISHRLRLFASLNSCGKYSQESTTSAGCLHCCCWFLMKETGVRDTNFLTNDENAPTTLPSTRLFSHIKTKDFPYGAN